MKMIFPVLTLLIASASAFATSPSPTPSLTLETLAPAIQKACQKRVDAGLFQGVIVGLIAPSGLAAPTAAPSTSIENTILCGEAKSEHEIYELGSISKSFAGIILAEFTTQGIVDLDKPISDKLPELAGFDGGKITLRQLATHTSGLSREYPGPEAGAQKVDASDLLAFLKTKSSLQFPVGSYHYSNVGFATIALVLSRVSQKGFQQLVQTEVLDVLAMGESSFMTTPTKPELLQGYDVLLEPSKYNPVSDLWVAAGGITSDLHDMMIYLRANMHPDASRLGQAMVKSQIEGLGWDSGAGKLPIMKNGAMTDGFSTVIEFDPTKNIGTVILGSEFSSPSMATMGYVAMGGTDTSVQLELSPEFLKSVSGTYVTDDGKFTIEIFPTHEYFLGARSNFDLPARLLSLVGQSMKFSVDNGSVSGDRILFAEDASTQQMTLTYSAYLNDDSAGNPVYDTATFHLKN